MAIARVITGVGSGASLAFGWAIDQMWPDAPPEVVQAVFVVSGLLLLVTFFWGVIGRGMRAMTGDEKEKPTTTQVGGDQKNVEVNRNWVTGDLNVNADSNVTNVSGGTNITQHFHFDKVGKVVVTDRGNIREAKVELTEPPKTLEGAYIDVSTKTLFVEGSSAGLRHSSNVEMVSAAPTSTGSEMTIKFAHPQSGNHFDIKPVGGSPNFSVINSTNGAVTLGFNGDMPRELQIQIVPIKSGEGD